VGEVVSKSLKMPLVHSDLFIKENVGTEEQRKKLKQEILEDKEKTPTILNSNDGCWRGDNYYPSMEWLYEDVKNLVMESNEHYKIYDNKFAEMLEKCNNTRYTHWTNVNESGSKNLLHTHDHDCWAGIYYLQADGTGCITFHNPANLVQSCPPVSVFTRRVEITPKDGDLFMWPGWLPHEVELNKSDKQRINIAWGVNFNYVDSYPMPPIRGKLEWGKHTRIKNHFTKEERHG
tara:strand:+ start:39 stop:737 length:699 start_codon:yes stop_codon:yes gene_type:complete